MTEMTQLVQYTKSDILQKEFPEFGTLDIYGTEDEPLFIGKQVAELLGNVKVHYDRDFELDTDYVKAVCSNKDGVMREQNMFTEQGIYNAIFQSRTDLGKKFRKFVTIVLKELRTKGQVSLNEALSLLQTDILKLQKENTKDKKYIAAVDEQLEQMNDKLNSETKKGENYFNDNYDLWQENEAKTAEINKDTSLNGLILDELKERYLSRMYFTRTDDEEEEPTEDEDHVWNLSKTDPKNDKYTFSVYVHTGVTLKTMHESLVEINCGFKVNDKWHASKHYSNINRIRENADELLLKK